MVAAVALAFVGIAMNGWFARSLGSSEAAGWLLLAIRHGAADAVTDRRQTLDTVMRSVEQSAQPANRGGHSDGCMGKPGHASTSR